MLQRILKPAYIAATALAMAVWILAILLGVEWALNV